MNDGLTKILNLRSDMSDYVFHFTKGPHVKAKTTLAKILGDKKLIANSITGVISFTEAPLTILIEMFNHFETFPTPMYSPYGIAIKKDIFFKLGGRPAIYGDDNDFRTLDQSMKWRYVQYLPNTNDFSWLREWRIKTPEIDLTKVDNIVITKTLEEEMSFAFSIGEISVDGCISDGQFYPEYATEIEREIKSLSIENLNKMAVKNRKDLEDIVLSQNDNEKFIVSLGGH